MYAKIIDGKIAKVPYSLAEMRADNSEVSISPHPTDSELSECGVARVVVQPSRKDARTWNLLPKFELNSDGVVILSYEEIQRPESEAAFNIRRVRDEMIARTDWVVARSLETNSAIPADYVNYRQALRDVPEQDGFPFSVEWPSSPA